jgi:hypothetical protein
LAAKALLFYFKEDIIRLGGYYVRNFIYNKPHHRYSIEYYLEKVRLSYESMAGSFSFYNVFVILSLCIFIAAALYCLLPARKKSRYIAIGLIFIDIFIFSFYGKGFRHNIRPFTYLTPDKPRILERLKNDHQVYRILPFNIKSGKLPNWALPNANITYGIDSTACYTPLASRIYRDSLPGLELVDDSLGLENPDNNAVKNNIGMLRLLNVKYIVSPEILSLPFLEKIDSEGDTYLYKLSGYLPRLFFSYDAVNDVRQAPLPDFRIVTYKDGLIKAELTADRDGFVVFSENYYPGWRVFVDGKEKAIIKVKEILQGVQIDKGRHSVVFIYKGE